MEQEQVEKEEMEDLALVVEEVAPVSQEEMEEEAEMGMP
jgi:hypothetical protein